jgi:hypothetical protein
MIIFFIKLNVNYFQFQGPLRGLFFETTDEILNCFDTFRRSVDIDFMPRSINPLNPRSFNALMNQLLVPRLKLA